MAMVGERVERHIADHAEFGAGLLDCANGPADQIVAITCQRAIIVLECRVDRRKDGNGRNAKSLCFLRLRDQPVDALTRNAGHRCHRFGLVLALDDEQRPDQIVD